MGLEKRRIITYGNASRKQRRPSILQFAAYGAGVCGMLLFFQSGQEFSSALLQIDLITAGFCFFLWWIRSFPRAGCWFDGLFAGAWLLSLFLFRDTLIPGLVRLGQSVWAGTPDLEDSSAEALFAMLMIAFLIFFIEFRCGNHMILYLSTTALLLAGPVIQMRPGAGSVGLILFFQIFFLVSQGKRGKQETEPESGGNAAARSRRTISGFTVAALLLTFILAVPNSDVLFQSVDNAEGTFFQFMERAAGRTENQISSGTVSRGNNYQSGTPRLEVRVSQRPQETIYLKGFEGGAYENGQWLAAEEDSVEERTAEILGWQERGSSVRAMLNSMYFFMNSSTNPEAPEEGRLLTIRYLSGDYSVYYSPYYSVWNRGYFGRGSYQYQYYETDEMDLNWQNIPANMEEYDRWQKQLQQAYCQVIQSEYIRVEEDELPQLSRLCRETDVSGQKAVTGFIRRTLRERASYTRTPGRAPYNRDIVEYFLFENHQGYCVHFASAAVLMYRIYDIPARYVSGYTVAPSDFERQEDGTYVAVVSDRSAHAWAEVFSEDRGWSPVEVTPPAEEEEDTAETAGQTREQDANQQTRQNGDTLKYRETTEVQKENSGSDSVGEKGKWFAILIAAALVASLAAGIFARRKYRLRKLERAGCRRYFSQLLDMLRFTGRMRGYCGQEPDFAEKLAENVPGISEKAVENVVELVSQAAFGSQPVSREAEQFVRQVYWQAAQELYSGLSRYKKIWFKWGRVFL